MGLLNNLINKGRLKSPWVVHFDCGSCNGCDIEVLACLTPVYDLERFGIVNVGNPKHADVLLVTGSVNSRNKTVLKNIYDQMPEPKAVVALGTCAMSGGMFRDCYNVVGGVDRVIPVDVYVPVALQNQKRLLMGWLKPWSWLKPNWKVRPLPGLLIRLSPSQKFMWLRLESILTSLKCTAMIYFKIIVIQLQIELHKLA